MHLFSIIVLLCLSCFLCAEEKKNAVSEELPYREIEEFVRVMQLIRTRYAGDSSVTYRSLMEGAMKGMLNTLDPYSTYEPAQQFRKTVQNSEGRFSGIGAVLRANRGNIEIVSTVSDGPARKGGVQAGDLLLEVDGKKVQPSALSKCVEMLRGPKGTSVKLKVYRRSQDKTLELSLIRDIVPIRSVVNQGVFPGEIGYFRISMFNRNTGKEIREFLRSRTAEKIRGVIIDLRNNPGGLLDGAVEACSCFLEKGKIVVSVEGKEGKPVRHVVREKPEWPDLPMVILINGNSASASEIFAGCMKDHRRAVLTGTRSFGKGLVQTLIRMPGKSGVRLTTAKYYTPNRVEIHRKGIQPDIAVPLTIGQSERIRNRLASAEDKMPSLQEDPQLERAREILQGILIFHRE